MSHPVDLVTRDVNFLIEPVLEEMGFELEVIRLSQLRSMPKEAIEASADTSSVSISFNAG